MSLRLAHYLGYPGYVMNTCSTSLQIVPLLILNGKIGSEAVWWETVDKFSSCKQDDKNSMLSMKAHKDKA